MRNSIKLGLIAFALVIVFGLGWYSQHPSEVHDWFRSLGRKKPLAADEVVLKQRTSAVLPGLEKPVKVRIDDIKRGKTADVEIIGLESETLASKMNAQVGDRIAFVLDGKKYEVEVIEFVNEFGSRDSARFRVTASAIDSPPDVK